MSDRLTDFFLVAVVLSSVDVPIMLSVSEQLFILEGHVPVASFQSLKTRVHTLFIVGEVHAEAKPRYLDLCIWEKKKVSDGQFRRCHCEYKVFMKKRD